jgi:hypothetical protein
MGKVLQATSSGQEDFCDELIDYKEPQRMLLKLLWCNYKQHQHEEKSKH